MLIGWDGSVVRRTSSVHNFKRFLLFSSESNQISYVASRGRGKKKCSNGPDDTTKMAATPIYGKNLSFSRTKLPMTLKLGMQHWVRKYYKDCSRYDLGLILTHVPLRSNFCHLGVCFGKK